MGGGPQAHHLRTQGNLPVIAIVGDVIESYVNRHWRVTPDR